LPGFIGNEHVENVLHVVYQQAHHGGNPTNFGGRLVPLEFDDFMRLALLCDDVSVVPWLDALAGDPTHEIILAATLNEAAGDQLRGRSGIRLTPHWEDLLHAGAFDAILVGGHEPHMLDAIKQLAASGQTLLFVPRTDQGSTFIYELSLVRDDNHVPIHPAVWQRCDPALVRLRGILRSGSLGQVHLFQFQRDVVTGGVSSTVSQSVVDAEMLLDFDLLRWLGGDYDQVTALRTGATEHGTRTQSVKLSGRGLPEATWDLRAGASPVCRLVIETERGAVVVERNQAAEWVLTEPDGTRHEGNQQVAVRAFLDRLKSEPGPAMEWHELVRAFETVDATHRSVRRRRTIDLHFEPMSERAIFKTQMTAIGCSVLIATFLLVLVYLAVAGTVPLPPTVLLLLRTAIFVPLGVFLLLQLLYPLTRPSETDG
jgi:myo-inositol 2-dehydrogenase/D-chiro-inositol 1-dehydrogenase